MSKIPIPFKLVIGKVGYSFFHLYMRIFNKFPHVENEDETVMSILKNKSSVARFGDGEFLWIFQQRQVGEFEKNSPELAARLLKVLKSDNKDMILCVPNIFDNLYGLKPKSISYWEGFLIRKGIKVVNILDPNKIYYDTQFTRPYMDYLPKNQDFSRKFSNLKKIWKDRKVLVVEGDKSRFGVGTDLLNEASSVSRILCPSVNAFEKYDLIYEKAKEIAQNIEDVLILISLGPTATILAYDLNAVGMQAIDIGHLDVEYNWFLMKATEKVSIVGKYVNEASVPVAGELPETSLRGYESEVAYRIGGN